MIHDATIVSTGSKDRKTNMEIKKPYSVVQCNKFMKGIDRADQYLSFHSLLRKTGKWSKKKTGTVSAKLCSLQCIFCVEDTKYKQKSKVQELSAQGRKVLDIEVSPILMTFNCHRSKQHQRGLKRTHQADCT